MSEPAEPPVTGNRLIDAALAEFGSLDDHPPAEHHDQLAQVHEVLASVLDRSRGGAQTPIPGIRRTP